MFHAYIIEVGGEAAGILAREGERFRFHATARAYEPLEGRIFADPWAAQRAARLALKDDQRGARARGRMTA
jgi:hypothetical protein